MKHISILIGLTWFFIQGGIAQTDSSVADTGITSYPSKGDTTQIRVGRKELRIVDANKYTSIEVIDLQTQQRDTAYIYEGTRQKAPAGEQVAQSSGDTTRIRVGRKVFRIFDVDGNTQVDVINLRTQNMDTSILFKDDVVTVPDIKEQIREEIEVAKEIEKERKRKHRAEGHYAGVGLGWNNYMDAGQSLSRIGADEFLDLNTSRSLSFNLNLFDYRMPIAGQYLGLVTGMGLELNNYVFSNNNSVTRFNGQIAEKNLAPGLDYKKSKLATGYLTIPLLLEFKIPAKDEDAFFISAGVFGSVKTWSYTKEVYVINDNDIVNRTYDDYYLSPFRYGVMARVGYGSFCLFANYSMTPFFEENRGPQLYPFTIGLAITD